MSHFVENAATLRCHHGTGSAALRVSGPASLASVRDAQPFVNIPPFGACMCPANPQVSEATRAQGGVLTPMPCIPAVDGNWTKGQPHRQLGGLPAVVHDSTAHCRWGGIISVADSAVNSTGSTRHG